MSDNKSTTVKVTATVGYDDKGARRYKQIIYDVEHWPEAMTMLFATVAWQALNQLEEPKIYGVTFAFEQ